MSDISCERVCVAAMGAADGRQADLPADQIGAHLAGCAGCRREVEGLGALALLLDRQQRREHSADLWPLVAGRLQGAAAGSSTRGAFALVGLMLLGYRLFEMLPERSPGLFLKVIPVLLAVTVFAYLRENPFRINPELGLGGAGK